jgi:hypothetical protein
MSDEYKVRATRFYIPRLEQGQLNARVSMKFKGPFRFLDLPPGK